MPTLSGVESAAFADDSTGDVVRFDRAHEDTTMQIRQQLDPDAADTRGDGYFVGYQSRVDWMDPDLSSVSQMETWMTDRTKVHFVAIGPEKIVQWYEPHYVRTRQDINAEVGNVDPLHGTMSYAGGDGTNSSGTIVGYPNGSHRIYASRNALHPLAYDSGQGMVDIDGDDAPDGYSFTAGTLSGENFIAGLYEANGPTDGSLASRGADIIMPLASQTWTLSVDIEQLHDDGDTFIQLVARSYGGTEVATDKTVATSTGRVSATITTPAPSANFQAYTLRAVILGIENASAQNAKARITKPTLRQGDQTTYVTR